LSQSCNSLTLERPAVDLLSFCELLTDERVQFRRPRTLRHGAHRVWFTSHSERKRATELLRDEFGQDAQLREDNDDKERQLFPLLVDRPPPDKGCDQTLALLAKHRAEPLTTAPRPSMGGFKLVFATSQAREKAEGLLRSFFHLGRSDALVAVRRPVPNPRFTNVAAHALLPQADSDLDAWLRTKGAVIEADLSKGDAHSLGTPFPFVLSSLSLQSRHTFPCRHRIPAHRIVRAETEHAPRPAHGGARAAGSLRLSREGLAHHGPLP
jgi:hypothetical protein